MVCLPLDSFIGLSAIAMRTLMAVAVDVVEGVDVAARVGAGWRCR